MSSDSLPYFLVFARIRGVGPVRLRKLIAHFGSLEAAWRAEPFDVVSGYEWDAAHPTVWTFDITND